MMSKDGMNYSMACWIRCIQKALWILKNYKLPAVLNNNEAEAFNKTKLKVMTPRLFRVCTNGLIHYLSSV
jgi:hypothetical protein